MCSSSLYIEMGAQSQSHLNTTKRYLLSLFIIFISQLSLAFTLGQALPTINATHCNSSSANNNRCQTFAILRANSRFSSLSKLSSFLGVDSLAIAEANGLLSSPAKKKTQILHRDRPLLIPIGCECNAARFARTAFKGETLSKIVDSLQGLTTLKGITEYNNKTVVIPIQCSCPSPTTSNLFFITYPVAKRDTLSTLAIEFNTTEQAIASVNTPSLIRPSTSLIIPVNKKPFFGSGYDKRKPKMRRKVGVYVAVLTGILFGVIIAAAAGFFLIRMNKKKKKMKAISELELQQLSLSVRTTSDKKVSFESNLEGSVVTPRKLTPIVENFAAEEIQRATEGFSQGNLIEGSVFHGRLNGKDVAVKRVSPNSISAVNIEFGVIHRNHPNLLRLLGTCTNYDESSSFLVFEYAANGSLKDWLHGGLAIKSQFIASCDCFLSWTQRLRICLHVASALHYLHHVIEPRRIHGSLKSSKIFLDEDFNATLGGLGLGAADADVDSRPSDDVFAFGVVLLEVLSGRAVETKPDKEIRMILGSGNADVALRDWMDVALGESYSVEAAIEAASLGRDCTDDEPETRPTMEEIVERMARIIAGDDDSRSSRMVGECSLASENSTKPLVKVNPALKKDIM